MSHSDRSRKWSAEEAPRFWWHRLPGMNYVPGIYSDLSESEWALVAQSYEEKDRAEELGTAGVPRMSLLHGLVLGNRAERIVQVGTRAVDSILLLGFMLRRMKVRHGLFVLETDRDLLAVSRPWIGRAELQEFVEISDNEKSVKDYLGGAPELVVLDRSHEYGATLREIDFWYGALAYGGMLVVPDVSRFAQEFDATKEGGVRRAFVEWRAAHPECESMLLNPNQESIDSPRPLYKDACGLGLIHKPRAK